MANRAFERPESGFAASDNRDGLRMTAVGSSEGLVQGKIVEIDGGRFAVAVGDDTVWAARSLSCLLEPAVGDKILLARLDGEAFVLAILDRLLPDVMTLSVPQAKRLVVSAPDLALNAVDRIGLQGREATVQGERVRVLTKSFSLVGQMVAFVADILQSTAHRSETAADHVSVQAGNRTTRVTGADVSDVGMLVQTIEQVSTQSAHTSIMTAKEDLRFDGKRVTVG